MQTSLDTGLNFKSEMLLLDFRKLLACFCFLLYSFVFYLNLVLWWGRTNEFMAWLNPPWNNFVQLNRIYVVTANCFLSKYIWIIMKFNKNTSENIIYTYYICMYVCMWRTFELAVWLSVWEMNAVRCLGQDDKQNLLAIA